MFGTIGHARPKPGHEEQIRGLLDEWQRTIRPRIPGSVLQMEGRPKDRPGEVIFVALTQDEATYRALAAMPEQDAWFRRFVAHIEAEPTWEDVELEILVQD